MPTICRFYGILIQMYYNDHEPPHFHVVYKEFRAVIAINDLSILFGVELTRFPGHAHLLEGSMSHATKQACVSG